MLATLNKIEDPNLINKIKKAELNFYSFKRKKIINFQSKLKILIIILI